MAPRLDAAAPARARRSSGKWGAVANAWNGHGTTFFICAAIGIVGMVVIGRWWGFLKDEQRRTLERVANETVAEETHTAQERMASRDWDGALDLLQEALATRYATNLDPARALATEAQRRQADEVLDAAESAIREQRPGQALALVRAYLADPHASDGTRAAILERDLELATSDEKARALLRELPDPALAAFAQTGTFAGLTRVQSADVQALYLAKLRGLLPGEEQRRADLRRRAREEDEQREARLRRTPAFRELADFVAATRAKYQDRIRQAGQDEKLLAYLFQELAITDHGEQNQLRQELRATGKGEDNLDAAVSQIRTREKERFRQSEDFNPADEDVFNAAVDGELARLLADLQKR